MMWAASALTLIRSTGTAPSLLSGLASWGLYPSHSGGA